MNLIIDIGNTSCKVALYDGEKQLCVQRFEDPSDLQSKVGEGYDTIVLATVRGFIHSTICWCLTLAPPLR